VDFAAGSLARVPHVPTDRLAATRLAKTQVPIHPPIAARWSPRVFDSAADIDHDDLIALLEAARWAATWGRRQPVRFVVGVRGDDTFARLADLLNRGNGYARAAGALILLCADQGSDENTALYSGVDTGSAMTSLLIEAVSRGLIAHPMAGFDAHGARGVFGLPDELRPLVTVAVGSPGDYAQAAAEVAERDSLPRERRPLREVVLNWPV
jgi:nitroreductase